MRDKLLIFEQDMSLPPMTEDGMRYVVAEGGTYVQRRTPFFSSCVRSDVELPLHPLRQFVRLLTPKIPLAMMEQAVGFLREVYAVHGGEGALVLLYDRDKQEYQWYCPVQKSSWKVEFETPTDFPPNMVIFGDIHSHPNGVAIPSGVDTTDEYHSDGLHIIAGQVTGSKFWKGNDKHSNLHFHVDFCVDSQRFKFKEDQVLELPDVDQEFPMPPDEWMERVTKAPPEYYTGKHKHREYWDC